MLCINERYFYLINSELFVEVEWLSRQYSIPRKTIVNGISVSAKHCSSSWVAQKNGKKKFVNYSSIPTNTVSRYKLPSTKEIINTMKAHDIYSQIQETKNEENFHRLVIGCALVGYRKFIRYYNEYELPAEEKMRLAKSHAVLDLLLSFNKLTVREKYILYNEIYDETFAFKATDYAYFALKVREIGKIGIPDALTKKYFGNANAVKVTTRVRNAILHLYKCEAKLSTSQITKLVNAYFVSMDWPTVSQTTVFTTIKGDPKLQNILNFQRDGEKWVKDKLYPKLARIHAIYPGDLYEIDGTRLQIPYKGNNNKPAFLVMVVLLDVCTRKVLSAEFGENETGEMYESAVRKAIACQGFLPAEILTDNFLPLSKAQSGFANLMTLMEQRGTTWRKHLPGNARDKGHIESFFKRFQHRYCRFLEGYVGEGVTSKNPDAHPSQEFMAKSLRATNLRTREQLIDRVLGLIQNYNNEISDKDSFERDSPNFQFDDLNKPNVIPLHAYEVPRFIYPLKLKQANNCSVCIYVNKTPYFYEVEDIPTSIAMNGTRVELRYDHSSDIPEKVYCYNHNTGAFLGEALRKQFVHLAKANQTSQDLKMIGAFHNRKKKIKQYLQAELEGFNKDANDIDPNLALLNPISYTKNEVKKAEDNVVLQLIKATPNKRSIKTKIRIIANRSSEADNDSTRIIRLQDLSNPEKKDKETIVLSKRIR